MIYKKQSQTSVYNFKDYQSHNNHPCGCKNFCDFPAFNPDNNGCQNNCLQKQPCDCFCPNCNQNNNSFNPNCIPPWLDCFCSPCQNPSNNNCHPTCDNNCCHHCGSNNNCKSFCKVDYFFNPCFPFLNTQNDCCQNSNPCPPFPQSYFGVSFGFIALDANNPSKKKR